MSQLVPVSFEGDEILCVKRDDGGVWVSVRRVCECLGLDAKGQRQRLQREAWVLGGFVDLVAANGISYPTYCIDLECLPMWLASIPAARVAPLARARLEMYQARCARTLADYFFGRAVLQAPHPWSVRFRQTSGAHSRFIVTHFPPGSWSVVTAAALQMLVLEDELIRHMMEPSKNDRPDVSLGLCWGNERRRRNLKPSLGAAPLMLPGRNEPVEVSVYPCDERPEFEEYFNGTYLPYRLFKYLARKPEFGGHHGALPCASTADHTCRELVGRPAVLTSRQRGALAAAGGFFPAGYELPKSPAPTLFCDESDAEADQIAP